MYFDILIGGFGNGLERNSKTLHAVTFYARKANQKKEDNSVF